MSDEPSHKAMLYFLEVLMNSSGHLSISQLAGRFGSSNFTPEMRNAAGGNEIGLKSFLQKYPSLFTIKANTVSLCDPRDEEDNSSQENSLANSSFSSRRSLPDVSVEMEAVQFFQNQMYKREEKWVPVKSLAGHLSQTSHEIRQIVGPQLDFKRWLARHVHIFDVQGDMVALRDGLAPPPVTPTTPSMQRRITFDLPDTNTVPPKTPPAQRRFKPPTVGAIPRSHSFGDRNQLFQGGTFPFSSPLKSPMSQLTMTANEYKTVIFLKETLEKRGSMRIQALLGCVVGDQLIKSTAGSTKTEMEEFLKRFPGIFIISQSTLEDANVELVKNAKLSVVITGNKPTTGPGAAPTPAALANYHQPNRNTTHSGKGKIFHVAKLWGIIDLGDHEHVFFDRSIMQRPMEDLQKFFQIGEILCFNAVLAHKTSRAKWKATRVWKENEQEPLNSAYSDANDLSILDQSGSIGSIEEEVNEFLPLRDKKPQASDEKSVYEDASLSGAGAVPIWNFRQDEEKNKRASVTVVPENYQMSASALSDLRFTSDFGENFLKCKGPNEPQLQNGPLKPKSKSFSTVACQTVSTSDIIATQLYQDS